MTQREAAERMGVSERWVRKLLKRMKREGDRVVVHRLRGRASNRKIAAKVQAQAIQILKQPNGHDFRPTFAAEQLGKRHQIQIGKETLRGWMIQAVFSCLLVSPESTVAEVIFGSPIGTRTYDPSFYVPHLDEDEKRKLVANTPPLPDQGTNGW